MFHNKAKRHLAVKTIMVFAYNFFFFFQLAKYCMNGIGKTKLIMSKLVIVKPLLPKIF